MAAWTKDISNIRSSLLAETCRAPYRGLLGYGTCKLVGQCHRFRGTYCLRLQYRTIEAHVPPKRWYLSTRLHGVMTQKSMIWIISVKTSNLIMPSVSIWVLCTTITMKQEPAMACHRTIDRTLPHTGTLIQTGIVHNFVCNRCQKKGETVLRILWNCEALVWRRYRYVGAHFVSLSDYYTVQINAPVHCIQGAGLL
jgi:hypothetical protein